MASLTVPTPVERVEDRDAVRAADDRLAVERERSGSQASLRGGDRGIAALQS